MLARLRKGRGHAQPAAFVSHPHPQGVLVASYNVHKCVGVDGRFDPERTGRVIREINADVIALQEADRRFGERDGLLDLARLEREAGLALVPVSGRAKAHGWHGNVVLFRRGSVRDVHQIRLPGLEPRGAIVAEIARRLSAAGDETVFMIPLRGGGVRIVFLVRKVAIGTMRTIRTGGGLSRGPVSRGAEGELEPVCHRPLPSKIAGLTMKSLVDLPGVLPARLGFGRTTPASTSASQAASMALASRTGPFRRRRSW